MESVTSVPGRCIRVSRFLYDRRGISDAGTEADKKKKHPISEVLPLKIGNTARMLCVKCDGQIVRNRLSSLSP